MATSTVPTVKQKLVDLLAARPNLKQVQVSYGAPFPNAGREFVWVGDAEGEQRSLSLANQSRMEEYQVQVVVSVLREGNDARAADSRCFELYAELEDLLRTNPDLDIPAVLKGGQCEPGEFVLTEYASDTARESRLTAQVRVAARI